MIKIDQFKGMIPRLSADKLPQGCAELALNVDLTSGALVPRKAVTLATFAASEIPNSASERFTIAAPPKPTVDTPFVKMCRPLESGAAWLEIWVFGYSTYFDTATSKIVVGGMYSDVVGSTVGKQVTGLAIEQYTDSGLIITGTVPEGGNTFTQNRAYNIYGPIYYFKLTGGTANGAPEATAELPAPIAFMTDLGSDSTAPYALPQLPGGVIPLSLSGERYGFFAVHDALGPTWRDEVEYAGETGTFHSCPGGPVRFEIDLNYVEPRQRTYHFMTTHLKADDPVGAEREGPPSEVTDKVIVNPGEICKLTGLLGTGFTKGRLYRTIAGREEFFLLKELEADSWSDAGEVEQAVVMPRYGNAPSNVTSNAFWTNSIIHPAQFAVSFHNDGTNYEVWLSEPFAWHVWPAEYVVSFPEEVKAIALAGGTVLVFTANKVYGLSGSNPEYMGVTLLTATEPLLFNSTTPLLCRLGQTVYYVSPVGLMATNGGQPENVTRQHYTAQEWTEVVYDGASVNVMAIGSHDNTIYLTNGTNAGLRFDLEEEQAALSTWSGTLTVDASSATWRSGLIIFDRQQKIDYLRIVGKDVEITGVTLTTETGTTVNVTELSDAVPVNKLYRVAKDTSWGTQAQVEVTFKKATGGTDPRIYAVELYERVVIPADGAVALTAENVQLWESIFLKYPDRDVPVVGSVSSQQPGGGAVDVTVWSGANRDATEPGATVTDTEANVADGKRFTLARDLVPSDLWEVRVRKYGASEAAEEDTEGNTPIGIQQLILAPRRVQQAEGVIREVMPVGGMPPWLMKRYEFGRIVDVVSVIARAETSAYDPSLTFNVYMDGATTATASTSLSNSQETMLNGGGDVTLTGLRGSCLDFDFNGKDHQIREVIILSREIVPVGSQGLIIRAPETLGWCNKRLEFPDTGSFSVARVVASGYGASPTISLDLKPNGTRQNSMPKLVANNDEFKLPTTLPNARQWDLELLDKGYTIYELHLIGRMRWEVADGRVSIRRQGEPHSWLGHQIVSSRPVNFSCGLVVADQWPVVVKLFQDGKFVWWKVVHDERPFRLPQLRPERLWELDAVADEGKLIHEVTLATSMEGLR